MKVKILGHGGAFSDVPTAFMLNNNILIDCGYPIVNGLIQSGEIANIEHVFITHFHMDHVSGLESLIYFRRFVSKHNLNIYASKEFKKFYETLYCSKDDNGELIYDFTFVEVSAESSVTVDNTSVEFLSTQHCYGVVPNLSMIFSDNTSEACFTGDVDYPVYFEENEKNQLIFHDMGWTGLPGKGVHPSEEAVFELYEYDTRVIGIHTESELKYFKKGNAGDIFTI